jgi:LysR family hydrogen peroxide-inducible transcriptional activator
MSNLPTLRQLQYLVALVELRHFGRAAERCFVTQSTLSAGLKELENILDCTLVERTKRRVMPTPLGEQVADHARRLLAGAEGIAELARSEKQPLSGPFRLGTIPTIGPFVLPRVLRRLRSGELDAALIALPYDVADLAVMHLALDPFWLAMPSGHPQARARPKSIQASSVPTEELLLLEEGHCLRGHALAACHLTQQKGGTGFQATSLYTVVEMVANGLGITFLPEISVGAGLVKGSDVVLKRVKGDTASRQLGLVWRKSFHRVESARALGAHLKKQLGSMKIGGR